MYITPSPAPYDGGGVVGNRDRINALTMGNHVFRIVLNYQQDPNAAKPTQTANEQEEPTPRGRTAGGLGPWGPGTGFGLQKAVLEKGLITLYKTSPLDGPAYEWYLVSEGSLKPSPTGHTVSLPVAKAKAPLKAKAVPTSSSPVQDAVVPAVATKKGSCPPAVSAKGKSAADTAIKCETI
ncbi:hypothetical protein HDU93_008552 [Gonapodya sp. JEL0774]|nr:hypothetical protein HDU93_008552 [Gonapodya sp. JEL0774]